MEFPRTRWTLILAARGQPEQRRRLLAELLQSYWKPLYLTLRARGFAQAPAEDAVQGFALTLLEKDALERLDPGKGRLRAYLKTALLHYVASEHARDSAQKRGGAQRPIALEVTELESASSTHLDPELEYQRAWARQVMERALAALRGEYSSGARAGPVELLELYFSGGELPGYRELAEKHAMSGPQLKSFLHRARERYRELLRAEVADTVESPDEIDAELGELVGAL